MEDGSPRTRRADAERNRRRLLDAATTMFCEHGLDVAVGDIADRAGVGRGTLFRNFPSKEDLIAAIVVERMRESISRGRAALDAEDPGAALFELLDQAVERSQTDRALFDALDESWLANEDIKAAHAEVLEVMDALLRRAQEAGAVRTDISAIDVLVMIKGMCEAVRAFRHVGDEVARRQLDLVHSALRPRLGEPALPGRAPTLADLEAAAGSA